MKVNSELKWLTDYEGRLIMNPNSINERKLPNRK
jgi:hypothetical protein